ncbi:MAG: hypothetical protein K6D96_01720 [Acetatifactor sp.]|nr:hypothetical protein [Acetatifactor sp.]
MEKLIKAIENLKINYSINTYGENYFYNAPTVNYSGICLKFSWDDLRKENEIRRYINRRKNLVIFNEGHNLAGHWFVVATVADREKHLNYRAFMDPSLKECEITAHNFYIAGHPEKVNNALYNIMGKYEKQYIKSLFKMVVKTA